MPEPWNKGRKCPQLGGANHHLWRGGVTPENEKIRHSQKYYQWRDAVYKRDDYTCQECGDRGGRLQADHVKPFAFFPELRFDVNNGRTLCKRCHEKTPTFGHKARRFIDHLAEGYDAESFFAQSVG
jgi:5-methylcytosine-specific restriction endonuclease McrA